jgi:hypothetical protein
MKMFILKPNKICAFLKLFILPKLAQDEIDANIN